MSSLILSHMKMLFQFQINNPGGGLNSTKRGHHRDEEGAEHMKLRRERGMEGGEGCEGEKTNKKGRVRGNEREQMCGRKG